MYIKKIKSIPQKFLKYNQSPFLYVQLLLSQPYTNTNFSFILFFKFDAISLFLSEIVMTDCGDLFFSSLPHNSGCKNKGFSFISKILNKNNKISNVHIIVSPLNSQSQNIYFIYLVGIILKEANCE
jgi:hypothetical protein